jgi:hypothetical protein
MNPPKGGFIKQASDRSPAEEGMSKAKGALTHWPWTSLLLQDSYQKTTSAPIPGMA